MFVRNAWYGAGWSHELTDAPLARKLLGESVVLFRDNEGTARALRAVCPHRGSDLGQGRVVEGALECPFHGWRFDGGGRCVRIPSQPSEEPIPAGARAPSYPVREQQKILWIWMGEAAANCPDPPRYHWWDEGSDRSRLQVVNRLFPAPFLAVVENALDDSHLTFIHTDERTFGADAMTLRPREKVVLNDDRRGFWSERDSDNPWPGDDSRALRADIAEAYVRFDLGGSVSFFLGYGNGTWEVTNAQFTPADAHNTWGFVESIRTGDLGETGDRRLREYHAVLADEDTRAAALSSPEPGGVEQPVHVAADARCVAFRRLYARAARAEGTRAPWEEREKAGAD